MIPQLGYPIGRIERLLDPLPTCTTKMGSLGVALVGCTASPPTRNTCAVEVIQRYGVHHCIMNETLAAYDSMIHQYLGAVTPVIEALSRPKMA